MGNPSGLEQLIMIIIAATMIIIVGRTISKIIRKEADYRAYRIVKSIKKWKEKNDL